MLTFFYVYFLIHFLLRKICLSSHIYLCVLILPPTDTFVFHLILSFVIVIPAIINILFKFHSICFSTVRRCTNKRPGNNRDETKKFTGQTTNYKYSLWILFTMQGMTYNNNVHNTTSSLYAYPFSWNEISCCLFLFVRIQYSSCRMFDYCFWLLSDEIFIIVSSFSFCIKIQ